MNRKSRSQSHHFTKGHNKGVQVIIQREKRNKSIKIQVNFIYKAIKNTKHNKIT